MNIAPRPRRRWWPLALLALFALAAGALLLRGLPSGAPAAPGPTLESPPWRTGHAVTLTVHAGAHSAGQTLSLAVLPPAEPQAEPALGLAGVQLTWLEAPQAETEALLAAASGVRFIGLDFEWRKIEPERGRYNWEQTDAALALAKKYNLRLVPMLLYTPRWASSAPLAVLDYQTAPPADLNAYRDFVYAVVRRYMPYGQSPLTADGYGIRDWVLWNEPNVNPPGAAPIPGAFWSGSLADYIQLLRAGYEGAHAADPGCNVLNGALADVYWRAGEADLVTALERFYDPNGDGSTSDGGRPFFDTLNIHIYQPDAPDADWYAQRLQAVERLMLRFGDSDKPIWISETGYGTSSPPASPYGNEAAQAAAVGMLAALPEQHPRVQRVLWWSLRDYYHDTSAANQAMEAHYGLLQSDFTPKLAYWALARAAGGAAVLRLGAVAAADGSASFTLPAEFITRPGRYVVFVLPPDGSAPLIQAFVSVGQ